MTVLSRLHRREALLRAYVRALQEHGGQEVRPLEDSTGAELGPIAMAFAPTVPPLGEPGRTDIRRALAEMGEWLRAEMMSDTLASYVGQIAHDSVALVGDRRREDIEKQVAELSTGVNPEELEKRCAELFLATGTPRLNLRLAQILAAQQRHATAATIERRTRSWLWSFLRATESLQLWSPWQCMATDNRVEGLDSEVLFCGSKALAYRALNSSDCICASACLRRGWVPQAVCYLLNGRALPDDADEFEEPDGVYQGTDAFVTHMLGRVLGSGKASEQERAALREAFPASAFQVTGFAKPQRRHGHRPRVSRKCNAGAGAGHGFRESAAAVALGTGS